MTIVTEPTELFRDLPIEATILCRWAIPAPPVASILCPTYNHAAYIVESLRGFLLQETDFPFEVLIHDDVSSDGTSAILDSFAAEFPTLVRVIRPPVNQYSQGKRILPLLLAHARGSYVAICEGDDKWINPHKLQTQVDFLEANPDYVACFHDVIVIDDESTVVADSRVPEEWQRDFSKFEMQTISRMPFALSICFRNVLGEMPAEVHKTVNGDMFLFSLLGYHGKGKFLPDFKAAAYRVHGGGVWSMRATDETAILQANAYYWLHVVHKAKDNPEAAEYYREVLFRHLRDALPKTDYLGKPRIIALYLPQFHPIPENDEWWGKGFTEWTNVTRAKPLFAGHMQPKLPGELGFYDLRLPDVREAQAALAREYGIEGFCYWHYWFGHGTRLLERPFSEVLTSGRPDFPFCVGWANHDWKGSLMGAGSRQLMKQEYPGEQDEIDHFYTLLPAFQDSRYIRVDGRPLLFIFMPEAIPDPHRFTDHWRSLAAKEGLEDLFIVGEYRGKGSIDEFGIDGFVICREKQMLHLAAAHAPPERRSLGVPGLRKASRLAYSEFRKAFPKKPKPDVFAYSHVIGHFLKPGDYADYEFPCMVPNWDTTPRLGERALVYTNPHPDLFYRHARETLERFKLRPSERNLIFIRSWNEWAEGNYLEPDEEFGRGRLIALRNAIRDTRRKER